MNMKLNEKAKEENNLKTQSKQQQKEPTPPTHTYEKEKAAAEHLAQENVLR